MAALSARSMTRPVRPLPQEARERLHLGKFRHGNDSAWCPGMIATTVGTRIVITPITPGPWACNTDPMIMDRAGRIRPAVRPGPPRRPGHAPGQPGAARARRVAAGIRG